jgi:hypothetical protein
MLTIQKQVFALFVERTSQQWIVRDPDGNFWLLPPGENGWEQRQPFEPDESCTLEPIPGHYRYLLDIPS